MMVVINGVSNSGKDSFCKLCGDFVYSKSLSTVDIVRRAAKLFGLDDTKNKVEDRNFMGELKQLVNKYDNHSFKYIKKQYESFKDHANYAFTEDEFIVFVHSREPKEIEEFKQQFGATTLLFLNPNIIPNLNNIPDKEVMNYKYDRIIINDGTLDDLKEKALNFTEELINGTN